MKSSFLFFILPYEECRSIVFLAEKWRSKNESEGFMVILGNDTEWERKR